MRIFLSTWMVVLLVAGMVACTSERTDPEAVETTADQSTEAKSTATTWLSEERLVNADADRANWLAHGRTYDEQRFSPLDQINPETLKNLELE